MSTGVIVVVSAGVAPDSLLVTVVAGVVPGWVVTAATAAIAVRAPVNPELVGVGAGLCGGRILAFRILRVFLFVGLEPVLGRDVVQPLGVGVTPVEHDPCLGAPVLLFLANFPVPARGVVVAEDPAARVLDRDGGLLALDVGNEVLREPDGHSAGLVGVVARALVGLPIEDSLSLFWPKVGAAPSTRMSAPR